MKKIIFFVLLFPQIISAQMKQKESYTVYVNYPDYTIKTDISSKGKRISVQEELTYYWYASNKIMETTGGYDGKILNGPYTSFYVTGNLKEKGTFRNGIKNGEWITWYETGKMKEINFWRRGIKSSTSKSFDINGDLISEAKYKNGKLDGYQTTYRSGKIITKKKYKKGIEVIKKEESLDKEKISTEPRKSAADRYKVFKEKRKSAFKKQNDDQSEQSLKKVKKSTSADTPKKVNRETPSVFKKNVASEKIKKSQEKAK